MSFTKTLTYWYSDNKRQMPWRMTKDPYKIWLSEVILQQTQISQGLPYYQSFVTAYPTIYDLAKASEEEVLKLWQGLGYYSRARNLHETAKHIAQSLNGDFPESYAELIKLKGIGDYTASAIGSICFGLPTAVVDGNVYRVLSRYYGIQTPINSSQGIKEFKAIAQKLIDIEDPGDHNQAMMEFGAMQCKPSSPDCTSCPLQDGCVAFNKRLIGSLPVKLKKNTVKKKYYNYIVLISEDGKTRIEKRRGKGIWQNLYQFPLIESRRKTSIGALKKNTDFQNLIEEKDHTISLFNQEEIIHKLSHQHLYTRFWIINIKSIEDNAIPIADIRKYPVAVLIDNFIEAFHFNRS